MADLRSDAALAADLVREAGTLALQMRRDGVWTEQKTSLSDLVTAADTAAEHLMVDHLGSWRPEDSVLAEEGSRALGGSGRCWVIDPVDGTYNFVRGLDWWCSAIALVQDDEVVLGAVYHPSDDALFVGGPDLPTTLNGERLAALTDRPLAESCVATYLHPPFYEGLAGEVFARAISGAATVRMLGSSSMDHAAIAQGRLEAFCQHSVADWDRLPGEALVRGVGGVSRRTTAAGVEWVVAGLPSPVAQICEALH